MTFSVAICDDSAPDRAAVQTLLAQWAAQRDLTVAPDIFASAEQFLFHYEDNPQYDLLLLDIEMCGMDGVTMATPLSYMYGGTAMPEYFNFKTMFLGTIPGCIGELSTLALLIGGAYLLITKVISWRIPGSYIGTVALLCLIFGKEGYGNVEWMLYNILAGGLVMGAIFMATDYATSPVTLNGQLLYGAGCGALTVLIRYFGGFPEGVTYAILIMNLCTWAIDKGFHRHQFGVSKEDIAAEKAAKKAAKEAAK